jgi:hypothetical protein
MRDTGEQPRPELLRPAALAPRPCRQYFLASAATASRSNAYKHVAGDYPSEAAFLEAYYAAVPTPKYFEFV